MNVASTTIPRATLEDLARFDGKAELIGGRIVPLSPTGYRPGRVAARIYRSLSDHGEATGRGEGFADNHGFAVARLTSGRQSFSPDAAFLLGPVPEEPMRFIPKPPTLAVEVRSENDDSPSAETVIAAKRDDFLEAGTLVVWDVDPIAETVTVDRAGASTPPIPFRKGQEADAEPAVPGWRVSLDWIFAPRRT